MVWESGRPTKVDGNGKKNHIGTFFSKSFFHIYCVGKNACLLVNILVFSNHISCRIFRFFVVLQLAIKVDNKGGQHGSCKITTPIPFKLKILFKFRRIYHEKCYFQVY